MTKALLALEDGSLFWGKSIGAKGITVGEAVFNTSMTGYQEILTDPSYAKQIVSFTYPHIGNVGVNPQDQESKNIMVAGMVIKNLPILASSWRKTKPLDQYLQDNSVIAIANIDTRRLTRILRTKGSLNACLIADDNISSEFAISKARDFTGLAGLDLARVVSTKQQYHWSETSWDIKTNTYSDSDTFKYHVVVYDYGVKRNILRMLVDRGCQLTIVPATHQVSEVLAMEPDGVFLSNGPGDPKPCDYAQRAIKTLLSEKIPLFGICLGYQLLTLASGAKSIKMKFGHHGANHPVKNIANNQVFISSQNHSFAVDEATLPDSLEPTYRSLFDNSLQGVIHKSAPAFGFQGHPEASPGPHDIAHLFDQFIELMKNYQS